MPLKTKAIKSKKIKNLKIRADIYFWPSYKSVPYINGHEINSIIYILIKQFHSKFNNRFDLKILAHFKQQNCFLYCVNNLHGHLKQMFE
jgi:hypothetical protein